MSVAAIKEFKQTILGLKQEVDSWEDRIKEVRSLIAGAKNEIAQRDYELYSASNRRFLLSKRNGDLLRDRARQEEELAAISPASESQKSRYKELVQSNYNLEEENERLNRSIGELHKIHLGKEVLKNESRQQLVANEAQLRAVEESIGRYQTLIGQLEGDLSAISADISVMCAENKKFATTEEELEGKIAGISKIMKMKSEILEELTGNNARQKADLDKLTAECERIEESQANLRADFEEMRGECAGI